MRDAGAGHGAVTHRGSTCAAIRRLAYKLGWWPSQLEKLKLVGAFTPPPLAVSRGGHASGFGISELGTPVYSRYELGPGDELFLPGKMVRSTNVLSLEPSVHLSLSAVYAFDAMSDDAE